MSKKKIKTWTAEEVIELQKLINMINVASLNFVVENPNDNGDSIGNELGDFIEDTSPGPQELLEMQDARDRLLVYVNKLSPREQKVIMLRYGFEDGLPKTLDEIGQMFKITRERVRQVETKALMKLRKMIIDKNKCHNINDF